MNDSSGRERSKPAFPVLVEFNIDENTTEVAIGNVVLLLNEDNSPMYKSPKGYPVRVGDLACAKGGGLASIISYTHPSGEACKIICWCRVTENAFFRKYPEETKWFAVGVRPEGKRLWLNEGDLNSTFGKILSGIPKTEINLQAICNSLIDKGIMPDMEEWGEAYHDIVEEVEQTRFARAKEWLFGRINTLLTADLENIQKDLPAHLATPEPPKAERKESRKIVRTNKPAPTPPPPAPLSTGNNIGLVLGPALEAVKQETNGNGTDGTGEKPAATDGKPSATPKSSRKKETAA